MRHGSVSNRNDFHVGIRKTALTAAGDLAEARVHLCVCNQIEVVECFVCAIILRAMLKHEEVAEDARQRLEAGS